MSGFTNVEPPPRRTMPANGRDVGGIAGAVEAAGVPAGGPPRIINHPMTLARTMTVNPVAPPAASAQPASFGRVGAGEDDGLCARIVAAGGSTRGTRRVSVREFGFEVSAAAGPEEAGDNPSR